ncbi:hypothetical protein DICSQDRAFT_93645 [Dichomitus squalens LYAD-421 SS1]|uniref:DUF1793-domain-containing protein n=1 Tax=Dichomitus squalens (strain LYAD-421) TaxID=732165 RepID=R7SL68_DICSQ|nr:uncharacterized protein DICSQDRAFT_93645 [Dichomitus squalens LYAD-421 SS1]EJF56480.1 hypothetical protein DICSQDRAFT_93645 [Dichomitus squalens LYAD-421 SS1]
MPLLAYAVVSVTLALSVRAGNWTATPFSPASVPLAVRSPYLSVWLPQGAGNALNDVWPEFWTGQDVSGWSGFAKVDGTAYVWMGAPGVPNTTFTKATQKSLQWTSTQSSFVMTAGPVDLNITFFSPVEPSDLVNQSLPLSYYSISAASNDQNSHKVQVYVDISGEWVTGTRLSAPTINWTTTAGDVITHQVQLTNQVEYSELGDHIQQGAAYHSTLSVPGTTYQTGQDIVVRAEFINNGVLNNTQDTQFRAVNDNWPVFAFAHDFGTVTAATTPVVYSVGHARDPAIQYVTVNNGRMALSSYFWTRYSTMADAIAAFLKDYNNAVARADAFDAQINNDARNISSDYASLVALSIRQTFGAIEITVGKKMDGTLDTSNILTFTKQISSDNTVNTVDVIYPSWPLFLYTNPAIGRSLLLPSLQYQNSGQYPNRWCAHDMGSSYPNATGHNDGLDIQMPVEESGNMLIMALSYTQWTNDMSLLSTYSGLLDQWTQFLVQDSLIPANQVSTDNFAGSLANQTNLAIKGIVGIQAMAEIARLTNDMSKYTNYSTLAASYVQQWQNYAISSSGSHLTLSYGDDASWGLTYNLYADKLLATNVFPSSVYDLQTSWYNGKANTYGVILDTRHTYTKSDWSMWTAATVTSNDVRDQIVSAVVKYASDGQNSNPLSDLYDTDSGKQAMGGNFARPVVGGHLALLALQAAPNITDPNVSSSSTSTGSTASPTGSPSTSSNKSGAPPRWSNAGSVTVLSLLGILCVFLVA